MVSDGRRLQVRYIGIDAPEIEHPTRGKDPYAFEAHDANALLVGDGLVFLERDVSDRDDSGRLLRFVWLEDGTLVNARLVEEAFAIVATLPPDVKPESTEGGRRVSVLRRQEGAPVLLG